MKKAVHTLFLIFVSATFLSTSIFCQDWPQWMGPGRDGKVTGFKAPATWPAELKQEWKVTVGSGDASPVLSGNKIFLNTRQGSEEVILCLDAATGKELWRSIYPCMAVTGPSGSHPGPRGTPAVSDGKVVTFGVSAVLSCTDVATGKTIWRKDNPDKAVPLFFTGLSPLITDNLCIVHTGKTSLGEIKALDIATGKEKWKWAGDGPSYASPAIMSFEGKKHLLVQTEKNLAGFDLADGKLLWQYPTPVQQRFYNCTSPCIDGSKVYLTGQGTGIKALEIIKKGEEYSVKELWSNPAVGAKWNTPVLKDGYLYGFSDQKRAYCVNAATGATAWIDSSVSSDFTTLVDCGTVLIGLPSTGSILVIKADPSAYTELARYKVAETTVYSFPLVAGNAIYVKDAETLTMYRIN